MSKKPHAAPDLEQYAHYPANYKPKFVLFSDAFPEVYLNMLAHAKKLQAEGRMRVTVKYLLEHERLHGHKREGEAIHVGLDNNLATWYGRRLAAENPELRDMLKFRRRRGEKEAKESGQAALEFD